MKILNKRAWSVCLLPIMAALWASESLTAQVVLSEKNNNEVVSLRSPVQPDTLSDALAEEEDFDSEAIDSLVSSFFDVDQVFAYRVNTPVIGDSMLLTLVDSMHGFSMPHHGKIISKFGPRRRRQHKGVDIKLNTGDTVKSVFDGVVRYAKRNRHGFGNLVVIRHFNGLETYYAHLNRIDVKPYEAVKAGEMIGTGGRTGRARGSHLHFEMRLFDKPFDPAKMIQFDSARLVADKMWLDRNFFVPPSRKVLAANGKTSQSDGGFHVIRKGDTLGSIARRYGTSVHKLCALNGLKKTSILKVGRRLKIG